MIDFWIVASLLLLAALAFLLVPLLWGRRVQREEDRTALNVALYQERLDELNAQLVANTLTQAELDAGRAEAERELLSDTQGSETKRSAHIGRAAPLVAAFLVPLIGYGLYMYWGASDKVQLAREFAEQPKTIEEMTSRLERAVAAQPDSAEAWYFLARTYMSQERPGDAAAAYARVIELSGRDPELLGQLAQALYFAQGRTWSEELQKLTDEALLANPGEVTSLGLLGIAAYEDKRYQDAIRFWERLVAELPEGDTSRAPIQAGITRAREQLGEPALADREDPQPEADQAAAAVQVQVALDPSLVDDVKADDALFIFARAVSGPPMPLAVKRLTVGQLPTTVSLSDADAMTPQLRLSNFDNVRLFARISRSGDALKGEWMGQSEPFQPGAGDTIIQLNIDQPDSR